MMIATHFDSETEIGEIAGQWVASAVQRTPLGWIEILAPCQTTYGDISTNSPQVVATIKTGHVTTITEHGAFCGKWDINPQMEAAA